MQYFIALIVLSLLAWVILIPGFILVYLVLPELIRFNVTAVWLAAIGCSLVIYGGIYYSLSKVGNLVSAPWYGDKATIIIYSSLAFIVALGTGFGLDSNKHMLALGNIYDMTWGNKPYVPQTSQLGINRHVDEPSPASSLPSTEPLPAPPTVTSTLEQLVMTEVFKNYNPNTQKSKVGAGSAGILDKINIEDVASGKSAWLILSDAAGTNGNCSEEPCPPLEMGIVLLTKSSERASILSSNLSLEQIRGFNHEMHYGVFFHVGQHHFMTYQYSTTTGYNNPNYRHAAYQSFVDIDAISIKWIGKVEIGGDNCMITDHEICGYKWSATGSTEKSTTDTLHPDLILTYSGTNPQGVHIDGRQVRHTFKDGKYSMDGPSPVLETTVKNPSPSPIGSESNVASTPSAHADQSSKPDPGETNKVPLPKGTTEKPVTPSQFDL